MKILVTGASSGIGRALVQQLVAQNHEVVGIARREPELAALREELTSPRFITRVCDVADPQTALQLVNSLIEQNWIPDIAVLGAAIFPDDIRPAFDLPLFKKIIEVNLFGVFHVINALLPHFLTQRRGQFIALGSMAVYRGSARGAGYPASKAALLAAMKSLAPCYRQKNIHFSTVIFGPILTSMWEGKKSFLTPTPEQAADYILRVIHRPKPISYYPLLSTSLYRLSLLLPDKLFVYLSEKMLK
ncbi:hypothetical protein A3I42_03125 [Candidatus Uhrbacteria bacterium RIFCSPLOWO2_02_FULL_49_11]|uniref:Short-chain dehydrogenase n=1 Tax=Candidatus Uhrbacteria bacterium RIFCSPLOWO2_02_FULL_49_11 TaxID=1802409 RepID=A0A1F7VBE9_9BACT|nr:MAG: hypothetical protein A3I42_03125 [Candidatus Uhrbacteria bacterium RIFCSPLOWO2_02_FULL_49_11]